MSEVTRHQLLITLVHGTWPRGFFPTLRRQNRRPLWFEEGSAFLARLSTELGDIPHQIKPLAWTGDNSIIERDKAARVLAEHLSAEHVEHPQAAQLAIAHSHGGNIALRALHRLRKCDASQLCGAKGANPFVVTLATPFIEIHQANFGPRPLLIRIAVVFAMGMLSLALAEAFFLWMVFLFPSLPEGLFAIHFIVVSTAIAAVGWWWIVWRATARQNKIDALKDATRLGDLVSAQRLLVIRAIDDEASLALALGTISNYLTARLITYVLFLAIILNPIILYTRWFPYWAYAAMLAGFIVFSITLAGVLVLSRLVHGHEIAVSPLECQINTQSVPDAVNLSQVVTLVSNSYLKSLRHGIYEHENCAKAISDWVRSQLGGLR
jgi:hypothetical protein